MPSQISIIFVLGPPGAGKGTLGALMSENLPVQHVSVGDLLRRIKNDTSHPQAATITSKLNKQELIDPQILVPILRNELEALVLREPEITRPRMILLDGFPRSSPQRKEFEEGFTKPILVLFFNCAKEIAKQRYLTRNLAGREADDEAMFEKRYEEFVRENDDLVREYRQQGLLVEIDTGKRTEEESWEELSSRLEKDSRWVKAVHG
ncbi:hypothetical protein DV737_g4495, partial [Chaetothyriales sp. CBS 132003]